MAKKLDDDIISMVGDEIEEKKPKKRKKSAYERPSDDSFKSEGSTGVKHYEAKITETKKEKKERADELMRDDPGMINKFTMLLSTGTTVKQAWEKIVQNYEAQKNQMGVHIVYEEMMNTCREMQGGVSEAEAYERFGKRCGVTVYLKFGALLSQNLRKGSKGLSDILRVEAIQSFENRKSTAKRLGEETGTKLLMPMLGMLSVVFIIVMVPAFMTMKF